MFGLFSAVFRLSVFSALFFLLVSCRSGEPMVKPFTAEVNVLNALSEAVAEREVETLRELKDHPDKVISDLAWKALAVSGIEDTSQLIELAIETNHPGAWYALTYQDVDSEQTDRIISLFFDGSLPPENVCNFLAVHGDEPFLLNLLEDKDLILNVKECSKAAGVLLTKVELDKKRVDDVAGLIYSIDDETTITNLLYGFWRSPLNRPEEYTTAEKILIEMVYSRFGNEPTLADEYLVQLTGTQGFGAVMHRRSEQQLTENVQLAVTTANVLAGFESDRLPKDQVLKLLNHLNPIVTARTLESLKQIYDIDHEWLQKLSGEISHFPDNPEVAITYLEMLSEHGIELSSHRNLLEAFASENPYLKNRLLPLFKQLLDEEEYYHFLADNMRNEGIEALHATLALGLIVDEHKEPQLLSPIFTGILNDAITDLNRSILSVAAPLLTNPHFFTPADSDQLISAFHRAADSHEQNIAQILVNTMEAHGISGEEINRELQPKPMRSPDWQRLNQLGSAPLWLLETTKGSIRIRLMPTEAPFTVSSIDYLTTNGYYEDVVFHRVVPNFVIQGGDFDRQDGFGGPDYRIPTEPSFGTFRRGMVGIASSGPDTEGSQFFITHTWTPHLDGFYTIFGEVIEGMDIVDQIQVGDRVIRARIASE